MTLSRWIRDYLFFPINSRFQGAPIPLYVSLLGVMGLVGMWHGIGWGFVAWGLLHGSYLVAYRIWENWKSPVGERLRQLRISPLLWQAGTFIAVMLAWVPFRASSFAQIKQMLASMLFLHPNLRISYSINSYLVTLMCLAVALLEPQLARLVPKAEDLVGRDLKSSLATLYFARPLLYAVGLLLFLIFDEQNIQFIYFQF
jgi:D-alanyl-lipoteichoic acid acyltransferase DltB (MBOAT superfamily)